MKKFHSFCFSLIIITLTACQSRFLDLSSQQASISITPPKESYALSSSVWLSNNEIVFTVDDSDRGTPNPFLVYSTDNQSWEKIPVPSNPKCQVAGFSFLERLPNGNIGFVDACITNGKETRTIGEINIPTGKTQTIIDSGSIRVAGKFSFSSDMTELVQEDMKGRFLSNKLYYRKNNALVQQLD